VLIKKSEMNFPTELNTILRQLDDVDPVAYGESRNYLNGAVTKLSPYISRGIISTRMVAQAMFKKGFQANEMESFLKELAWRDYFQQVWLVVGDKINTDLKQNQPEVKNFKISESVLQADTGVLAIDQGIKSLYQTGYMHNHMRMYVASITLNLAKSQWKLPAQWMYYHLLDADWASNALGWQWVGASFSGKKYYANQENVNRFCNTNQLNTFLDVSYETLSSMQIPRELSVLDNYLELETVLPSSIELKIDTSKPTYIYTFYNLDPFWDTSHDANRVLILEPSFFETYPSSPKVIDFVIQLSKNIPNCQIFIGEFQALELLLHNSTINFKEHPTNSHFSGKEHSRDWMFPMITGYFPSFFAFWKKCEKQLAQLSLF
jgi:deoxyribodipyrimidine photo-lyase